jgi:hypothetical protein
MSILKSFWCITSYRAYGDKWYFYSAVLEESVEKCLERFKRPMPVQDIEYKVYEQQEMPEVIDPTHTSIRDHRKQDQHFFDKKHNDFSSRCAEMGLKFK